MVFNLCFRSSVNSEIFNHFIAFVSWYFGNSYKISYEVKIANAAFLSDVILKKLNFKEILQIESISLGDNEIATVYKIFI